MNDYGFVICTYIHDGRRYRQHYLAPSARFPGAYFWARSPERAVVFEDENDAREVAHSFASEGYWIAQKALATC